MFMIIWNLQKGSRITEKAAAILESIVKNHPFVDGNKRTGYVLARLMLMNGDVDIVSEPEEKYQFAIGISTGKLDFDQIKAWLQANTKDTNT